MFGIGGNKEEVEEAINRLTDRNETLQTAIEDLTDVMESSKGTKSVAAYADAKKLQRKQKTIIRELHKNRLDIQVLTIVGTTTGVDLTKKKSLA